MKELSPQQSENIEALAEQANVLIDQDNFKQAHECILKALEIIPEPKNSYGEATWLYATQGDIYFLTDDYKQALLSFTEAVQCPEGLGNPFIHLRLGECQFECGNMDRSADELIRAYMSEGLEIFELEDPKYFEFLKTRADIKD
jgi:tetratricopeptide (TPR) repeat protein